MISGLSNAVVIEHAITRLLRALSDGVCVYGVRAWTLLSSVQCYAWTEYKFTCVCVCLCVTLSVNSPTGQTPQQIFKRLTLR